MFRQLGVNQGPPYIRALRNIRNLPPPLLQFQDLAPPPTHINTHKHTSGYTYVHNALDTYFFVPSPSIRQLIFVQIYIKRKNSYRYPVNNNCKSRIRPKEDRNRIPELGALLVFTGKHFLFPFGTNGERKNLFILFWSDTKIKIQLCLHDTKLEPAVPVLMDVTVT